MKNNPAPSDEDHRVRVAADRRARMLDRLSRSAMRVMAHGGVEAITVDAIVAEAEVSRGTFYKYYDAPASLVREVGIQLSQELILSVSPSVQISSDPAVRLGTGFRLVLHVARKTPILPRFLVNSGWPSSDRVPAFTERVEANLAAGIEQGRFSGATLAITKAFVGGATIGMMANMLEADAGPEADAHAALSLLRALGLETVDALAIVRLPLPEPVPFNGLLADASASTQEI